MKFEIEDLVAEMLDQLPTSVWTSTTTTFFDPAIGGGQFVKEIERRLRVAGHSESNIHMRVFGFEESELHIRFAVNKYKLIGQYVKKPYDKFLEMDNSMKFDVVIGNPPFQSSDSSLNLWPLFVEKGIAVLKDNGHLGFITPTTWMRPSTDIKRTKAEGGSKYIFKDFMQVYNTQIIDTVTASKFFNVGSTFSYYIICKEPTTHNTLIKCKDGAVNVNLSNFKLFPQDADKITLSIFEKLQSFDQKFEFKGIRNDSRDHLEYTTAPSTKNKFMYVGGQFNKKNFNEHYDAMIYYAREKHPEHNKPKIIVNYIGDIKPYVDDGNCGMQYCQVHYLNAVNEVDPARSVVKSKLFKFAYKFVRYGMHNEAGVLNALSKPPLNKIWTDSDLYQYFKLTNEEIDYIENAVK